MFGQCLFKPFSPSLKRDSSTKCDWPVELQSSAGPLCARPTPPGAQSSQCGAATYTPATETMSTGTRNCKMVFKVQLYSAICKHIFKHKHLPGRS